MAPTCYRHPDRETYISCQRCDRPICPDCMRDAAVGFQCPSCVAEGRKQTRSGRTPYGGQRSDNPALTSYVLIALNVAVFLAIQVTGRGGSNLLNKLMLFPIGSCESAAQPGAYYRGINGEAACQRLSQADGSWTPGVDGGAYWQLITSAFTHVELWHIAGNMLALYFLGPQLELAIGRARFLALYFGSALAGSALVYWFAEPNQGTLGASGAIFGLFGAILLLALKVGGNVRSVLTLLAVNGAITFIVPGISWQGHVGGFVGGTLIAAVLIYSPRNHRAPVQAVGVGLVLVVVAVAIVLRSITLA